jgi:hypothetical protein
VKRQIGQGNSSRVKGMRLIQLININPIRCEIVEIHLKAEENTGYFLVP